MKVVADIIPDMDKHPNRKRETFPEIHSEEFWRIYTIAAPYTLLHIPGLYNLFQSVNYICRNKIEGDLVECGCFLGGAAIMMWHTLALNKARRTIRLFDTFTGFDDGEEDIGTTVKGMVLPDFRLQVLSNLSDAGASTDDFVLVQGKVENTLPGLKLPALSLLRLDTDFYSSTKVEFETLYPKLVSGGVLIVDDYGVFQGARKATDDYLQTLDHAPLLNRVCVGAWAGVKP